jgi:spore maturation protein SpmA
VAYVWFALVASAVLVGAFSGTLEAVTQASIESAKAAVTLALGLVGVMTFWLGMMRVLRDAGLLRSIARALEPLLVRLFPDVPRDHPAMSAMVMNLASNMLGLGNAATPFGIKAMVELERLNQAPGVASNAMVLFLAINTSGVALAPLGVIALRASLGSENAAGIWIPTLLATCCSTAVAIVAAKALQRVYPVPPAAAGSTRVDAVVGTPVDDTPEPLPASPLATGVAAVLALALGFALALEIGRGIADGRPGGELVRGVLQAWLLPVLIVAIAAYGFVRRVNVYDAVVSGGREGFEVALRIIPFLVAILVAVGMFRASGALDLVIALLRPLTGPLGFPAEALPMALVRPLSGSGAYGILAETMQTYGPDSHVGLLVSTIQGSTETTFYVIAVYFGAAGVTRLRHAVAAGLLADVAGVIGATVAVNALL